MTWHKRQRGAAGKARSKPAWYHFIICLFFHPFLKAQASSYQKISGDLDPELVWSCPTVKKPLWVGPWCFTVQYFIRFRIRAPNEAPPSPVSCLCFLEDEEPAETREKVVGLNGQHADVDRACFSCSPFVLSFTDWLFIHALFTCLLPLCVNSHHQVIDTCISSFLSSMAGSSLLGSAIRDRICDVFCVLATFSCAITNDANTSYTDDQPSASSNEKSVRYCRGLCKLLNNSR